LIAAPGCSTAVHVSPHPESYIANAPVDVSAGLLIEDSQAYQTYTMGGGCLLGMLNHWQIETGPALMLAAQSTLPRIFSQVTPMRTRQEFEEGTQRLLISPSIASFYVSSGLSADLVLHCRIVDRQGKLVHEGSYMAKGPGQAGSVFWGGFFAGQGALSKTSSDAFEFAFTSLATDIRKRVDFTPYLGP
jgi:hypothetical protein